MPQTLDRPAARPRRRSAPAPRPGYVTAEEYLRREEEAVDTKHEWYDGEVREMPGVSLEHAALEGRILELLGRLIRGKPFVLLTCDLKVRVPDGPYVYPDTAVAPKPVRMEPPIRPGGPRTVLTNPAVIAEVLSGGTEETDRGEKLDGYRTIPSLTDYLLFSQHEPRVDHYRRDGDRWPLTIHTGPDAVVPLPGLGGELAVAEIYAVLDGLTAGE